MVKPNHLERDSTPYLLIQKIKLYLAYNTLINRLKKINRYKNQAQ